MVLKHSQRLNLASKYSGVQKPMISIRTVRPSVCRKTKSGTNTFCPRCKSSPSRMSRQPSRSSGPTFAQTLLPRENQTCPATGGGCSADRSAKDRNSNSSHVGQRESRRASSRLGRQSGPAENGLWRPRSSVSAAEATPAHRNENSSDLRFEMSQNL